MPNKPITSLTGYIKKISSLSQNLKDDEILLFRGQRDKNHHLNPNVLRNNDSINSEHIIFRELVSLYPDKFESDKNTLEQLIKAQHYGLPTRLLDLTFNPLVALYFAIGDLSKPATNGKIFIFRIKKDKFKYYDSDTVSILSNISKRPPNFCIETLQTDKFNDTDEIQYLLHDIREEKSYFRPIINSDDIGKVIAVKVKQSNSRIIKQSGAFLIFGIGCKKTEPAQIPEEWLIGDANAAKSVNLTIDKGAKEEILKQLDRLGINESTLFPELDNQARYLKNKYLKEETPVNAGITIDAT